MENQTIKHKSSVIIKPTKITEYYTRETKRAITFLVSQIKKGWTAQEVFEQVKNQYGNKMCDNVILSLQHYYQNNI